MRSISLVILVTIFASSFVLVCPGQTNQQGHKEKGITQKSDSTTFKFLKKYDKKYPYEVKLLDNSILKQRLKTLLGNRYSFLKSKWAVEIPIEIKDNIFIAYACETHNCDATNFMIIVDINRNIVYAGIREERKAVTYSEDNSKGPVQLQDWAKENNY
jgi:hypothetical protein